MAQKRPLEEVRTEYIEKMGLIVQTEGLPRSAGRLVAMLMFDGRTVSFGELAEELQISRGGVSTAVRILEDRGLVKRVTFPGDRQDYFQIAPNTFVNMLSRQIERLASVRADIDETIGELPEDDGGAGERLGGFARFYEVTSEGLSVARDRLRDGSAER